jgi:hypothetical protein
MSPYRENEYVEEVEKHPISDIHEAIMRKVVENNKVPTKICVSPRIYVYFLNELGTVFNCRSKALSEGPLTYKTLRGEVPIVLDESLNRNTLELHTHNKKCVLVFDEEPNN